MSELVRISKAMSKPLLTRATKLRKFSPPLFSRSHDPASFAIPARWSPPRLSGFSSVQTLSSQSAIYPGQIHKIRTGLHNKPQHSRNCIVVCNTNNRTPPEIERSSDVLQNWQTTGLWLFGAGFVLGVPLDAIHSRVQLQVYDNGALEILGLHTNVWVFPLLGVFYSVAGLLQLVLDNKFAAKNSTPQASLKIVAASLLSLAVLLEVSAELYKAGVPYNIEAYILFGLAELNWVLLDNTWWGFALACFVGVAAPIAEIPFLKLFGLWHYPKANIEFFGEGFVTWLVCCYFFYMPFLSNLARWLSTQARKSLPDA